MILDTLRQYPRNAAAAAAVGALIMLSAMQFMPWLPERVELWLNPVVTADVRVVRSGQGWVDVQMSVDKRRPCEYLGIQAYRVDALGVRSDALLWRDAPTGEAPRAGFTRPVGAHNLGTWTVRYQHPAKHVEIWVSHRCDRRVLVTELARIGLPNEVPE